MRGSVAGSPRAGQGGERQGEGERGVGEGDCEGEGSASERKGWGAGILRREGVSKSETWVPKRGGLKPA